MRCGVCGGGVRGFSGTLHGRPIKDWKHTDVPPGTLPHRPVLGTPVDEASLARIRTAPPEPVVKVAPGPPTVPPRPVEEGELCQSARGLLRLLEEQRWVLVEEPVFFETAVGVQFLVVRARRRDLGVVASWIRRREWVFESGWEVARRGFRQVGFKQLKDWVGQWDEQCPDCGASSAAHDDEECDA